MSDCQKDLKTLELVENICDSLDPVDLTDICIIGAQHILPTTLRMFLSLINRGLKPSNIFLVGKCYSTDTATFNQMISLGMFVCPNSREFKKNLPFDKVYKNNIKKFISQSLQSISERKIKKLIVLDDGGELILQMQTANLGYEIEIVGVEQTSSGYAKLQQLKQSFPIINVARSKAKLLYESPIIAITAVKSLFNALEKRECVDRIKEVLIFGNGAIGQAIDQELSKHYQVTTYDTNPALSQIDEIQLIDSLPRFDIVIGCTGKPIIKRAHFSAFKSGVILASLSSSDREFLAVNLRKLCPQPLKCHDDFTANNIKMLNCGFPINFNGNAQDTDPEIFELTRAILVGAVLFSILQSPKNKAFIPLDESIQDKIIDLFAAKYLKERISAFS